MVLVTSSAYFFLNIKNKDYKRLLFSVDNFNCKLLQYLVNYLTWKGYTPFEMDVWNKGDWVYFLSESDGTSLDQNIYELNILKQFYQIFFLSFSSPESKSNESLSANNG